MQNNHLAPFSSDIKHAEPDLVSGLLLRTFLMNSDMISHFRLSKTKRRICVVGFDSVRPDILHRAVTHQLAPNELAKLQDAESTKDLAQAAPTLETLLPLLRLYFDILSKNVHLAGAAGDVNAHFLSYVGQLAEFAKEHGWSAVLDYHLAFHGKRLGEMASGGEVAYAAWAVVDGELWAKYLQGKKKGVSQHKWFAIFVVAFVVVQLLLHYAAFFWILKVIVSYFESEVDFLNRRIDSTRSLFAEQGTHAKKA